MTQVLAHRIYQFRIKGWINRCGCWRCPTKPRPRKLVGTRSWGKFSCLAQSTLKQLAGGGWHGRSALNPNLNLS